MTDFMIGEFATLAYGTRAFPEIGKVELSLRVKEFNFSAYPANRTQSMIPAVRQIYDGVIPIENVWGTALSNGNPECHTGPCLLNAGRIEFSNGEFWLYVEGITEHTVNVLLKVGEERMALDALSGINWMTAQRPGSNEAILNRVRNHCTSSITTVQSFLRSKVR